MGLIANVTWFTPTWDLFIILSLVVAVFLLGLTLGRNKIIIFLISIYIAIVVITFFPFGSIFDNANTDNGFIYQIISFLGVVILLYILLVNSVLKRAFRKTGDRSIFQIAFFSLFCIGLILSVVLSFLPKDWTRAFNPLTQKLFITEISRFLWALIPVLGMAMTRKRKKSTLSY